VMEDTKAKAPELGGQSGLSQNLQRRNPTIDTRRPLKWKRVLEAFLAGRSFNRFQAERELHDHCLHSTVSTLQGMGVNIHRQMETVPGFQGCPTEVMRYWLAPASRHKAMELLGRALPCTDPSDACLSLFDAIAEA
jgi:hypothetical protein